MGGASLNMLLLIKKDGVGVMVGVWNADDLSFKMENTPIAARIVLCWFELLAARWSQINSLSLCVCACGVTFSMLNIIHLW